MKYAIYSYRDVKAGFGSPMCDISDETAIRGFSYAVNNRDGIMNFSPKDFDLYKIGTFDTVKGVITPLEIPELIVSATSVMNM